MALVNVIVPTHGTLGTTFQLDDTRGQAIPVKVAQVNDAPSTAGAVQEIRFPIANTPAVQSSVTSIPAGSQVIDAQLSIVTPFSPGATITIGNAASPALLMTAAQNNPQAAAGSLFSVDQDTTFNPVDPVQATIAGAPAAGAAEVIVRYVASPQP
jgi:hypothetical protein